jgi:hypothetical protein
MRTKITAALLTLAASIGLLVTAAPAQAALTDCPTGSFCIWTATNYGGSRYQYSKATLDAHYRHGIELGSGVSNRGYSFYNHTTVSINIYDSADCSYSPWTRTMARGQYATAQGSDWGGRVSSIQITAYQPSC